MTVLAGLADVTDAAIRAQLSPIARGLFGLLPGRFLPLRAALLPAALMLKAPGARRVVRPWLRLLGPAIGGLSPADRRALEHPRLTHLLETLPAEALQAPYAGLGAGPAADVRLLMQPWTVALHEITQPVRLWYGGEDRITPAFMGEHLRLQLPNATLQVVEGQGHISALFEIMDRVFAAHAEAERGALRAA